MERGWRRATFVLIVLLLALLACKKRRPETVVSQDGVVSMTKPAGWSTATDLNDEANLQLKQLSTSSFVIVISEPRQDLAIGSLQEYYDIVSSTMRKNSNAFTDLERKELMVGGLPALQYRIDATVDHTNVSYLLTVVQGRSHYHQVMAWSSRSRFARQRPSLETVLASFRELK